MSTLSQPILRRPVWPRGAKSAGIYRATDPHRNMKNYRKAHTGFTLIEALVTIAVIGVLAALLLPALSAVKARSQRTVCANNLRQIATGLHLYASDNDDRLPSIVVTDDMEFRYRWRFFKELTKSYDGLSGPSSPADKLFACPADRFYYSNRAVNPLIRASMHDDPWADYSSYWFSRFNLEPNPATDGNYPGIAGVKISSIRATSRTLMVVDQPAVFSYSWHKPQAITDPGPPKTNDNWNMGVFVDGHAKFLQFYFNPKVPLGIPACGYEPPAKYEYQWGDD